MSSMPPSDYHKRFLSTQRQNAPSPLDLAITPTTNRYPSVGYEDDRAISPCASSVGENTYFLDSGTGRPVRNVTSVHLDTFMGQRREGSYYDYNSNYSVPYRPSGQFNAYESFAAHERNRYSILSQAAQNVFHGRAGTLGSQSDDSDYTDITSSTARPRMSEREMDEWLRMYQIKQIRSFVEKQPARVVEERERNTEKLVKTTAYHKLMFAVVGVGVALLVVVIVLSIKALVSAGKGKGK
ncbi:hypothetical protein BZA77DRAFT_293580 [Pyronema omphalodes]|nr:hypothetical protein BZA77DRAFT_293580 [Pyronema omphalodes]